MSPKIYKRGAIWWARIPNLQGGRALRVSTHCTDRKAAELAAADLERRQVDPTYRAAHETKLSEACDRFLAECDDRDLSPATRQFYLERSRHLTRGFALVFADRGVSDPPLFWIDARTVALYVELRKSEGAHSNSISKDLIALTGALALAKHRGEFVRTPAEVMPRHFSAKYVPRTGFLEEDDAPRFVDAFPAERARFVAFCIATGCRYSEAGSAMVEDIDLDSMRIHIRGTKTARSKRFVPITSLTLAYVRRALDGAPKSGLLLQVWGKGAMHRDMKAACLRTGIARWVDANGSEIPVAVRKPGLARWRQKFPGAHVLGGLSANDLRRTFASWLLQRGVDTYLISKVLGHVDTKMLERVYGQIDAGGVGRLIEARLSSPIPVRQLCAPAVHADEGTTVPSEADRRLTTEIQAENSQRGDEEGVGQ